MSPKFKDRYYRVEEIADFLSVDSRTIRRIAADPLSNLPAVRINRSIRIHGHDLNMYLKSCQISDLGAANE